MYFADHIETLDVWQTALLALGRVEQKQEGEEKRNRCRQRWKKKKSGGGREGGSEPIGLSRPIVTAPLGERVSLLFSSFLVRGELRDGYSRGSKRESARDEGENGRDFDLLLPLSLVFFPRKKGHLFFPTAAQAVRPAVARQPNSRSTPLAFNPARGAAEGGRCGV